MAIVRGRLVADVPIPAPASRTRGKPIRWRALIRLYDSDGGTDRSVDVYFDAPEDADDRFVEDRAERLAHAKFKGRDLDALDPREVEKPSAYTGKVGDPPEWQG